MPSTLNRTLIATLSEFVGTLFLTLAALTALPPVAAFAVGLTLLTFVYTIGGISGCHLNPAVTAGLVAARRFPLGEGLAYIVAQVCGALAAQTLVRLGLVGTFGAYKAAGAFAEFIGVGILVLAVCAVTENKVTQSGSGIAVGGALIAGLLLTQGILNPAVAIAMNQGTSPAVWATLVGGIVFGLLFELLKKGTPPKAP